MKKVTKISTKAFLQGKAINAGNTISTGKNLYLFGNCIAKREGGKILISNAGWFTNTTKERLNGLPGVSIVQKRGVWYLNGEVWDGTWKVIN
jgi:hypothetical protein